MKKCFLSITTVNFFSSLFLSLFLFNIGCKKTTPVTPSDVDSINLHQSIVYRTVATIPSPADSSKGRFKDSVIVNFSRTIHSPDYLKNFPNVNATIIDGYGFGFNYLDGSIYHYFAFSAYAFPKVPRDFEINKIYEATTSPGQLNPVFLGSHTGREGMTYFVDNIYPADAGNPSSKVYTKIVFSKRKVYQTVNGPLLTCDGLITGYCIQNYGTTDIFKYVHRWDFSVSFTGLHIPF
jgi:hypothetical protein